MDKILKHSINKINTSNLITEPWDHIIIDNFLNKNLYNKIKKDFDNLKWFHDNNGNYKKEIYVDTNVKLISNSTLQYY